MDPAPHGLRPSGPTRSVDPAPHGLRPSGPTPTPTHTRSRALTSPLAGLGRIKVKLGLVIVLGVATAFVVNEVGIVAGVPGLMRAALATLLALLMVQVLTRGMTKPLRDMAAGAQTIAMGRYDLRVEATSRDEVGELARAFNAMAADLGEVDRQRRELVANVSHELRTPITALRAVLENLVDGVSEPDQETLGTALAQAERLGRLVAQLLDLSRLESGIRIIESRSVELRELCDQAVREAGLAGDNITIKARAAPGLALRADPDLLAQVLANLLDNAVRHSPPGGVVTLAAVPRGTGVRLTVTDQGPGIPLADRARVFERFSRLDAGRAADDGGTGLGLAITKEIVELHNGSIRVDDGPGCTMTIDLPGRITMSEVSPAAPVAPPAETPKPQPASPYVPPPLFPRPDLPRTPGWLLPAAGAVGVLASIALPYGPPGIGLLLVAVALGVAAAPALRERITPWSVTFLALAYGLVAVAVVRDADWLVSLLLLAAFLLAALAISGNGRGWLGVIKGGLSVPMAVLRLPWFLEAPFKRIAAPRRMGPVLVGAALTGLLLLVFGALFSSADAVFSSYLSQLFKASDWLSPAPTRIFVFVVFGALLAAAVLAALQPAVEPTPPQISLRVSRAMWFIPLSALNLLFATFVVVQISVLFGGQRQVLRTAGLTYAEYARSGFFQLVWISVFVLAIVAVVAGTLALQGRDRWLIAGQLGLLCGLTLVVLASAQQRLALYIDVYGLSRLRASVGAAIFWLAAIFALVLIAGALRLAGRGRAYWLPRTLVAVTGVGLLAFGIWNPDLRVAQTQLNVREAGRLDVAYLGDLASEAVPALDRLAEPTRSCVLRQVIWANRLDKPDPWNSWNLARVQARDLLSRTSIDRTGFCEPVQRG
ncbi:DUF4153 domain-containing protein [Actinopolymorpha alba]|uniref:DUF4153 domain-containing protein n=1 Tax=Actinopolymorpha alba TaxID=533267 RepID=UPI00035C7028|nr:DUF4153 domain-containing protein [Actinopolymorpha alba]